MALLGSSIDPSLFSNDYSGFARAAAIKGQSYEKLGEDIRATVEKAAGAMAGVPTGGSGGGARGSAASGIGGGGGGGGGGGLIGTAADIYNQTKQFKGQQEAFGKSMDYMAKAFPDKADMFQNAKSSAFDPNANMIQQAAAINQWKNQFDLVSKMESEANQQRLLEYKLGGGASGGSSAYNAWIAAGGNPKITQPPSGQ